MLTYESVHLFKPLQHTRTSMAVCVSLAHHVLCIDRRSLFLSSFRYSPWMNRKLFVRLVVNTFSHTFPATIQFTVQGSRVNSPINWSLLLYLFTRSVKFSIGIRGKKDSYNANGQVTVQRTSLIPRISTHDVYFFLGKVWRTRFKKG